MRASELTGREVIGPRGPLGRVLDMRVVQDGPLMGAFAALRVEAFVVGTHGFAQHLGYDRHDSSGPWLIKRAVRWMTRNNRLLPWADARLENGVVRTDREQLDPLPDL